MLRTRPASTASRCPQFSIASTHTRPRFARPSAICRFSRDAEPADRRRRAHLPHRTQRRRQVEPAESHLRRRAARRRSRSGARPACACRGSIRTCPALPTEPSSTRSRPGLGELGDLVARYHHAAVARWPTSGRIQALDAARRAAARARGARRLAARADESRRSSRGCRCRRNGRSASSRADGAGARCSARRSSRSRICCCSTSRRTISTSTRSSGSKTYLRRVRRRAALRHPRPRVPLGAGDAHRRSRSRHADVVAGQLRRATSRRRRRREEAEARALDRLDKKLAKEEAWLRQGVKARRTRNEGRVRRSWRCARERARAAQRRVATCGMTDRRHRVRQDGWSSRPSTSRKSFGGVPVVRDYTQRILRGDRIGLIGPNGSGKTTLLKLLTGELEPDAGTIEHGARVQIAYFDQQREQLDPEQRSPTASTTATTPSSSTASRSTSSATSPTSSFRASAPCRRSKSLSGGERNRLMLARLFARPANVLVMDEPTNDLDIETLELLEELIARL